MLILINGSLVYTRTWELSCVGRCLDICLHTEIQRLIHCVSYWWSCFLFTQQYARGALLSNVLLWLDGNVSDSCCISFHSQDSWEKCGPNIWIAHTQSLSVSFSLTHVCSPLPSGSHCNGYSIERELYWSTCRWRGKGEPITALITHFPPCHPTGSVALSLSCHMACGAHSSACDWHRACCHDVVADWLNSLNYTHLLVL